MVSNTSRIITIAFVAACVFFALMYVHGVNTLHSRVEYRDAYDNNYGYAKPWFPVLIETYRDTGWEERVLVEWTRMRRARNVTNTPDESI
jgi:hypothetical protein